MALIRSIPSCELPTTIFLIKDITKGPYNFVNKILNLTPNKYSKLSMYKTLYYIDKESVIKALNSTNLKLEIDEKRLNSLDCDELESYLCKCYRKLKKNRIF